MYRIQPVKGDQWAVIDERDEIAFVGTLGQCEDWLDFQENAQRQANRPPAWWHRVRQLFRGSRNPQPHPNNAGDPEEPRAPGSADR